MYSSSISVVIPVYRSEGTLEKLNGQLTNVLSEFQSYEIIYVDDASPDSSFEVIRGLVSDDNNVIGIALDSNYGQQSAILCGLSHASKGFAVIMDDDLEHNPQDIIKMYQEIQKGYDVVYALNSDKIKTSLFRSFGSWLRDITFNMLASKPRNVKVCSFRIISKNIVTKVCKAKGRFVYISMEILKHTQNISNIYVKYGARISSGHSTVKLIKLLMSINVNYSKCRLLSHFKKEGEAYRIRVAVKKGSVE